MIAGFTGLVGRVQEIPQAIGKVLVENGTNLHKGFDTFMVAFVPNAVFHLTNRVVDRFFQKQIHLPFMDPTRSPTPVLGTTGAFFGALAMGIGPLFPPSVSIALAVMCVVQYFFFPERPPIPAFIKQVQSLPGISTPKELADYLELLKKDAEKGQKNLVFAKTGMSLALFVQHAAAKFPGKKVFYVDGVVQKERLGEFVCHYPEAVLFSRQKDILNGIELPRQLIYYEIFSWGDRQVGEQKPPIHLGNLLQSTCLNVCGSTKEKPIPETIFKIVASLDENEKTAGLVSVDGIAGQLGEGAADEVIAKAVSSALEFKLKKIDLITICKSLGIKYIPSSAQAPNCLSRHPPSDDKKEKLQKSLRVFGGHVDTLHRVYKPNFTLEMTKLAPNGQLNEEQCDKLLTFLYANPDTVLFADSMKGLEGEPLAMLLELSRIVLHINRPDHEDISASRLAGWFESIDIRSPAEIKQWEEILSPPKESQKEPKNEEKGKPQEPVKSNNPDPGDKTKDKSNTK